MRSARSIAGDQRLVLAAIVLLAAGLRLVDAGARLSHDEGYSWLVATAPNAGAFLGRIARYENTPPLFYLLLSPLPLTSELWLRLPSLVASVLAIPVLYAIVRPLLGVRAALLATLGVAVAPFMVSYSDYSRGFMVAGLGLLLALLAAQRLASGGRRRWWWLFAAAGAGALYSEYYAALYLAAMLVALLALGRPARRATLAFGSLPFVAFLPWLPQVVRSVDDLGRTKLPALTNRPSPASFRDEIVPLFFGVHGSAASVAMRTLQGVAVVGLIAFVCVRLRRSGPREAFWLLAGTMIVALCLQLVVALVGPDVFRTRYLTSIVPLACAVVAGWVATVRWRYAVPAAAAALAALALAVVATRAGREYEPDSPAAVALASGRGYTTILTNSAVVAFYGRHLHVVLDRPFGIGRGIEHACAPRCAVLDDQRFGGVRAGPGARLALGPLVIRFPPAEPR